MGICREDKWGAIMQESSTIAYMSYMQVLKTLTWEDNWKKYMYAPFEKGVLKGVLNLMIEFSKEEYGYTVHEAFLKATEIKASSNRILKILKKVFLMRTLKLILEL